MENNEKKMKQTGTKDKLYMQAEEIPRVRFRGTVDCNFSAAVCN